MKRVLEAISGAERAGADVLKSQRAAERDMLAKLLANFEALKRSLKNRLLAGVTDFKRFNLQALLADVDRLIRQTEAAIQGAIATELDGAAERGTAGADEPTRAVGVIMAPGLPGIDAALVDAAFGNVVDLLTVPMKQYGADVKAGLRRVSMAGDNKFEEIQKLRDKIAGGGFDNAQFRAERIIRTEVGRVFNAAQFNRMETLAQTFKFLRKGWRSTNDGRTRIGHREAGTNYARGQGIRIASPFSVKVYNERPGKSAKLIGTASLRFPLDPNATPAGHIAAGATIMCRCNGFVDFSQAELTAYNTQRVQLALGDLTAPPTAGPLPEPPRPKPVRIPRAKKPAPLTSLLPAPGPVSSGGTVPVGTAISNSLKIPKGPGLKKAFDLAREAMRIIDSVHGDGNLLDLAFKASASTSYYGAYTHRPGRGGDVMKLSKSGIASHPLMTVAHETGHWLDDMALGKGLNAKPIVSDAPRLTKVRGRWTTTRTVGLGIQPAAPPGFTNIGSFTSSDPRNSMPEMKALKDALRASAAYQALMAQPTGMTFKQWNYYKSPWETFARAYSQYVAVKSGEPAMMLELLGFQSDMKAGKTPPIQWQASDFKPIEDAFDRLFLALGWLKKG